ncbi:peptidoglycan-associated lipoprotein Pal [Sphingomonas sp. NSE70-1]|uniref:Peptidoglycan-associated lipoprotein n=1 Tax=Sphingomonas caseinilyticus TaxID=2908205 RepID=A0ABT0RUI0_9SPHN|nr:peptidoglycan-associated lipoprotein Pal [Sphingomonas caseinilyticus]MCL6698355.1 peptidoglycan-associated lipoprotein Pal [Sphingomonas caseinilyticus]
MRVAAGFIALLALAACGQKTPPADVSTAILSPDGAVDEESDVDLVELPALQADLVARAGSDSVYFDTDQSGLDETDRQTLATHAQWLMAHPNVRASIEGHADERGTREYNLALGQRRAQAALDYLVASGVPASRLLIISWGKERPIGLGSNESSWSQNRRAVTVIVK